MKLQYIALIAFMFGCGMMPMKPLPPLGCSDTKPICICDNSGNCEWQFICIPY